jgi:hypothetical protein
MKPTTGNNFAKDSTIINGDQDVVEKTIKWLESIENEERRKLVNALKRTKTVIDNTSNPKLLLAKRKWGNNTQRNFVPVILKGERHGKPRFSLEYMPDNEVNLNEQCLSPNQALAIAQKVKVERSNYAHRIKLAFMFLASKYGTRENKSFCYSTDGEHFTKAYKSIHDVPAEEKTITHQEALDILKKDIIDNPSVYESPAFGVSQTKVFRVSPPQTKEVYNEELDYSYTPHGSTNNKDDLKTSWITISKRLENTNSKSTGDKKAYYQCNRVYTTEPQARSNKNYKLLWPANQIKSLVYLLDLCKELILNQSAKTLGEGDSYFATIYEKKTTKGPEGLLYKALICQGKDKTEASKNACSVISKVWTEEGGQTTNENSHKNTENTPIAITCLSLTDCSLLKYLIESNNNSR